MYYVINGEIIDYTKTLRDLGLTTSALVKNIKVNTVKLKVYKKVLQEVCKNFVRAEEFNKHKTKDFCCKEKLLSLEEVPLFYYVCHKCF